jgi:uroporphyrinogen-III synthase
MKIVIAGSGKSELKLSAVLKQGGADAVSYKVIEVMPVESLSELDERLKNIENYSGIFLTSLNAAEVLIDRMKQNNIKFSGKFYAVGVRICEMLKENGYESDSIPEADSAENLIKAVPEEDVKDKKFLYPRGNLSLRVIPDKLGSSCNIDEVIVYNTVKIKNLSDDLEDMDCIVFMSPSSVESFLENNPEFRQGDVKVAAIGSTTAQRAEALGLRVDIVPERQSGTMLAEAILKTGA